MFYSTYRIVSYPCEAPESAVPAQSTTPPSLRVLHKPSYPRLFADSNQLPVRRPSAMHQCARDDLTLPAKAANAPQLATNVDRVAPTSPPITGSQPVTIHPSPSAKRLGRMAKDRFVATQLPLHPSRTSSITKTMMELHQGVNPTGIQTLCPQNQANTPMADTAIVRPPARARKRLIIIP